MRLNVRILLIFLFFSIIGALLNIIAMETNNGKMPVLTHQYISSSEHFGFTDKQQINNYFLSDIFKIETKKKFHYISIGDFLIYFGSYSVFILSSFMIIKIGYDKIKKLRKEDYGFKVYN